MSESIKKEIAQRLEDMFLGWSPGETDFSIEHVADFYDQTERFFAFDTLMPTTSVMKGWKSFTDNWELVLEKQLRNFICTLEEITFHEVSGDISWMGLYLSVTAEDIETGNPFATEQQVSLVWENQNGVWRIIHEHLSGPIRK